MSTCIAWRITKYNPQYRDDKGVYLKDEWSCYSDIGKKFESKELTQKEYLKVENAYVDAVLAFMDCLNIDELQITDLEQGGKRIKNFFLLNDEKKIINGQSIYKESLRNVIQLILRNMVWGKFESKDMYVHFGYDFYMYIGCNKPCKTAIKKIEESGLFVEEYESPYHK